MTEEELIAVEDENELRARCLRQRAQIQMLQEAAENYHAAWQDAAVYWLDKVARLKELAGDFFCDLAYMGDYLFWKHHQVDLEEHPWLEQYNPFPAGCPYFPETLNRVSMLPDDRHQQRPRDGRDQTEQKAPDQDRS